jgi:hypothetical protein
MTGGLIQIVAYGTADIFLTGMPQITFFKLVYRRYTNFAIENIVQRFSGTQNFGNTISCTIDKIGDLVSKVYLQVTLPDVMLINPNYISDYTQQDAYEISNLQTQYNEFKIIINYIYTFYREINSYISGINQNISLVNLFARVEQITNVYYTSQTYSNLKTQYNSTYNRLNLINTFIPGNNFYDSDGNYLYGGSSFRNVKLSDIDIIKIIANYNISSFSNSVQLVTQINNDLFSYVSNTSQIDKFLYKNIQNYQKLHLNYENYKFAWVQKIGHQIIKTLSLEIGGQVIDRHDNDWYNIWNDLSLNSELQTTYDKLIGNVRPLITYDYTKKNSYTLNIPLNFWFNKYIGGALPLVFLRYNDVRINLELRNIRNLIFTDAPSDFNFEDTIEISDINLLVDYIYLDVDERTKFAQSPQEYLIEVVQNYNYLNVNTINTTIESFFINSVKEMFWVAQSNTNLANNILSLYDLGIIYKVSAINYITTSTLERKIQLITGIHVFNIGDTVSIFNSQFYNGTYTIIDTDLSSITIYSLFYVSENDCFVQLVSSHDSSDDANYINPFDLTTFTFEQYQRFQNYDNTYTNFVQPWQSHTKTPSNGINSYSFALIPEQYQPSGAANLSSYKYKSFVFQMNSKLNKNLLARNDALTIKTYALGYNILSFRNGMATLVFNI